MAVLFRKYNSFTTIECDYKGAVCVCVCVCVCVRACVRFYIRLGTVHVKMGARRMGESAPTTACMPERDGTRGREAQGQAAVRLCDGGVGERQSKRNCSKVAREGEGVGEGEGEGWQWGMLCQGGRGGTKRGRGRSRIRGRARVREWPRVGKIV